MSKTSGEKARANIQKKRRTAQRVKDRALHAELKRTAAPAKEKEEKKA